MKKYVTIVFALVIVMIFFTGCTSDNRELLWTKEDCEYCLGRLERLDTEQAALLSVVYDSIDNFSIDDLKTFYAFDTNTALLKGESKTYEDISTLLLGLERGDFQLGYVPTFLGKYITSRNKDIKMCEIVDNKNKADDLGYTLHVQAEMFDGGMGDLSFRMATLQKNKKLINQLNDAISTLKKDGTIDEIQREYIDNVISGKDPKPVKMPFKEGAETIRVAVTGDLPPLDYVSKDGKPAGFNIALLSKISEKIGYNIEIVSMNTGARLINLTSGKVDAIFWLSIPNYELVNWDKMNPHEMLYTEPFYVSSQCFIYSDYPEEYMWEFEFGCASPERSEHLEKCLNWRLAWNYFNGGDSDPEQTVFLKRILDDYRSKMSEKELRRFMKKSFEVMPW